MKCTGAVLIVIFFVGLSMVGHAASLPKDDGPLRQSIERLNRELQLSPGQTCGDLLRSIREYQKWLDELPAAISFQKQRIKKLQEELAAAQFDPQRQTKIRESINFRTAIYEALLDALDDVREKLVEARQQAAELHCPVK